MVFVQPEQRAAGQETSYLVAPVVENIAVPVRVDALPGVLMLEKMRAVKESQGVLITREMRRHPVEDNTNIVLMQIVYQIHKVLGPAVAAGGCEITRRLVAPGAVEGVLH